MRIVILGAGNIATFYGIRFKAAGHEIVQVLSSKLDDATQLASILDATPTNSYTELNYEADLYVLGVRDDVLFQLANNLRLPGKIIIYGAGAVPLPVLQPISNRVICLWCMFSVQKNNLPVHRHFPVAYNVAQTEDLELAKALACLLSDVPYALNDEQKSITHLSAVFVNNFTNHLYCIAQELMQNSGIDFHLLYPMIFDTAQRVETLNPKNLQTGPAMRHDEHTMTEHQSLLANNPMYAQIYRVLSESIQHMHPIKKQTS